MDAGDFIYIIIAIALVILNAFANSKKKKTAAQTKQAQPLEPADDELLTRKLQELLGEEVMVETNSKPSESVSVDDEEKIYGYGPEKVKESETVGNLEYEKDTIDKPLSEAELYPVQEVKPLDIPAHVEYAPLDIAESKVEGPIGEYSYQESFDAIMQQFDIDIPEMTEDDPNKKKEVAEPFLADFDPAKAIVYSVIIQPKYF